jgi:hypothetical protein
MQNSELVNTGVAGSDPVDVFSVFDSVTVPSYLVDHTSAHGVTSMNRPSLARGAVRPNPFKRRLNIAGFAAANQPLTAAGDRLVPVASVVTPETSPATSESSVSALDPGALDVLLDQGWSARLAWIVEALSSVDQALPAKPPLARLLGSPGRGLLN